MINTSFRVLLEVPQRGAEDPYYRDIFEADYVQGESPNQDELIRRQPVADSSASERAPAWTSDGKAAFLSDREKPGLYLAGPCQPLRLLARRGLRSFSPSPDGGEWLFTTREGLFRMLKKGQAVEVPVDGLKPVQVAHSPSGEVFFSAADGLYRLAEPPERIATGVFQDFAFSPDGEQIAFVRPSAEGSELRVLALGGDERLLRSTSQESSTYYFPEYCSPSFSPDGSRVLYSLRSFDGSASHFDLRAVTIEGCCSSLVAYDVMAARPQG